jgi:vacuolar-type H+-ATPase subunit I/STV1
MGALLSNPILSLATAVLEGYLIYIGLLGIGLERVVTVAGGVVILILGFILQLR